jgi:predicted lipoprotein with Yx(FWY)xxD motif
MRKRYFLLAAGLVLALGIAGCGSSGGTTTAATPTAAAPALIQTGSATVKGISQTVLTDARGLTLYYYMPDTPQTAACTGQCAVNWPPLLFNGTGMPTAAASAPGMLSVQKTANGNQVAYNGHFLYTFKGDSAPGQANGQGLANGQWQVATPDLGQSGY